MPRDVSRPSAKHGAKPSPGPKRIPSTWQVSAPRVEVVLGGHGLQGGGCPRGAREVVRRRAPASVAKPARTSSTTAWTSASGTSAYASTSSPGSIGTTEAPTVSSQPLLVEVERAEVAGGGGPMRPTRAVAIRRAAAAAPPRARPARSSRRRRRARARRSNGRPRRVSTLASIGAPTVPPSRTMRAWSLSLVDGIALLDDPQHDGQVRERARSRPSARRGGRPSWRRPGPPRRAPPMARRRPRSASPGVAPRTAPCDSEGRRARRPPATGRGGAGGRPRDRGHDRLPVDRQRQEQHDPGRRDEPTAHRTESPPSTSSTTPVTQRASSDARYATARGDVVRLAQPPERVQASNSCAISSKSGRSAYAIGGADRRRADAVRAQPGAAYSAAHGTGERDHAALARDVGEMPGPGVWAFVEATLTMERSPSPAARAQRRPGHEEHGAQVVGDLLVELSRACTS